MQEREHPSEGGRHGLKRTSHITNPESGGLISSERDAGMHYLMGLMIWRRGLLGGTIKLIRKTLREVVTEKILYQMNKSTGMTLDS